MTFSGKIERDYLYISANRFSNHMLLVLKMMIPVTFTLLALMAVFASGVPMFNRKEEYLRELAAIDKNGEWNLPQNELSNESQKKQHGGRIFVITIDNDDLLGKIMKENDDFDGNDYVDKRVDSSSVDMLRKRALDSIGGGALLGKRNFDSIGGVLGKRALDGIGGGALIGKRALDSIGGGALLGKRALDSIGGGALIGKRALDSIGGGALLGKRALDSIGGGALLGKRSSQRNFEDNPMVPSGVDEREKYAELFFPAKEITSLLKKRTYGSLSLGGSYGTSKRGDMSLLKLGSGFGRTSRGGIRSDDNEVVPRRYKAIPESYLRSKNTIPHIFVEPVNLDDLFETDKFASVPSKSGTSEYAAEEFNQAD